MIHINRPIFVTQPSLPPFDEFIEYLKEIWETKIITNIGPFHMKFEQALKEYLGVKYISVFSNGTLALITALQSLRITGEVITSPYSFVATTHSLWWNNIKPVFVDIESEHFNLDPDKIEAAITKNTTAILPVHVYGNPCKTEAIERIADKYGLKVIYDCAHAFGVTIEGNSVMNFGDLSVMSFHATKVFNTIEGGAIVCHDENTKIRVDYLKNFGFVDEVTVTTPGINAKMNELQAAYGLLQLKYIKECINKRKTITNVYRKCLSNLNGISFPNDINNVNHNYSYFPILVDSNKYCKTRDELYEVLKQHNIFSRRYFYPLISQFPTYRGLSSAANTNLPTAEKVALQVICLPIYPELEISIVEEICNLIAKQ